MRISLFLVLISLTMAQAGGDTTPKGPLLAKQQALENLKKEIEALHHLLDQTEKTPIKQNNVLKERFRKALERAHKELKNIDKAMETYKQGGSDQLLSMSWQRFEQNISSQIAVFEGYLAELQRIYLESKAQDQTSFGPVTPPDGKRTTPVNRKTRRRRADQPLPPPEDHDNGPSVHYHLTTEPTKDPTEEPFLR